MSPTPVDLTLAETTDVVVVTLSDDVRRLLDGSPEPFTPATKAVTNR